MVVQKKALKQLKKLKSLGNNPRLAAEGWDEPWKCLVSTMLSAQTRDTTTVEVCKTLFRKFKSLKAIAKAKLSEIEKIIKPVNYYKTKAKNLKKMAEKVMDEFDGEIPYYVDGLTSLPGVGRKTANVFLQEQGRPAIGVDTHVKSISKYLGWTSHDSPDRIEEDLKELFPRKRWNDVNPALVKFGQTYRSKKKWKELLDEVKAL